MASMNRVRLPDPPRFGNCSEWWLAFTDAEMAIREASNRLIDGLELAAARLAREEPTE